MQHLVDIHGQAIPDPSHTETGEITRTLVPQCPPCGQGHMTSVLCRIRTILYLYPKGVTVELVHISIVRAYHLVECHIIHVLHNKLDMLPAQCEGCLGNYGNMQMAQSRPEEIHYL